VKGVLLSLAQALLKSIRQRRKLLTLANTLAYDCVDLMTAVNSFMILGKYINVTNSFYFITNDVENK
jgi:hypothetical protein